MREALRLLQDNEAVTAARLREFREEIERRLASLERGEGVDAEEVFEEIRRMSAERRKARE